MMLDTQPQTEVRQTVTSAVYRAVAESDAKFKEAIKKQLAEKQAEEARKLRELQKAAASVDVVDVKRSELKASASNSSDGAQADPQPARGVVLDVKA